MISTWRIVGGVLLSCAMASCSCGSKAHRDAGPPPSDAVPAAHDAVLGCADDGLSYKFLRAGIFHLKVLAPLGGAATPSLCVTTRGVRECQPARDWSRSIEVAAGDVLQVLDADGSTLLDASTCPGDGASWLAEWSKARMALPLNDLKRPFQEVAVFVEPDGESFLSCGTDGSSHVFRFAERFDVRVKVTAPAAATDYELCIGSATMPTCHALPTVRSPVSVAKGDIIVVRSRGIQSETLLSQCLPAARSGRPEWWASSGQRVGGTERLNLDPVVLVQLERHQAPP